MSIIVVEGVDASGKSTLMENLRTVPGYFLLIRHSCRPLKVFDLMRFLKFIENEASSMMLVVDRHPLISEPIYGPLLRRNNLVERVFTPNQVVQRLEKTISRVIYCRPPKEAILHNLNNRPQLTGVNEHIHQLLDDYDQLMMKLSNLIPVVNYDYTVPTDLKQLLFGG